MSVELVGYSERGMMNALCYDLLSSQDPKQVETFLGWFAFPLLSRRDRPCFTDIKNARLIVEQSFSDFGDLDLLVLLEHNPPFCDGRAPARQAVLIEAKVSTDTNSWQTVGDRFGEFMRMIDGGEGGTSNLFVQLHRKMRRVEVLRNRDVPFLPDLLTPQGRLGANQVVRRACRELKEHVQDPGQVWYGAIVPDDPEDLHFFARDLAQNRGVEAALSGWEGERLGFLSWKRAYDEAKDNPNSWSKTVSSFAWNEGQIFREDPPVGHDIQPGGTYLYEERPVFVVPAPMGQTCRVAFLEGGDPPFFWRTKAVPLAELSPCPVPIPIFVQPYLPAVGQRYRWVDRNYDCPRLREPHPPDIMGEATVEVVNPSWHTTRVRRCDAPTEAGTFLVCIHYLQRQPVP